MKGDAAVLTVTMSLFRALADKFRAWLRYREAVNELSQLSDEELHDIGVSRGEIEYVARH